MAFILIIDDSTDNASLVKALLDRSGHDVEIASNGMRGWERITEYKPDIIILDLRLPGSDIDGWKLIQLVRDDESSRHIPIIVTSVEARPEDRQRALEVGCDVYLSKPFKIQELKDSISQFLGTSDE